MDHNDNRARMNALKQLLSRTDYQALKYAEGAIPKAEYEAIRAMRQAWRDEINQLEGLTMTGNPGNIGPEGG